MTIFTEIETKYPPSRYELLREASYSEDPSFSLKNLKESIRSSQQNGDEVTNGQIQEHWKIEDFFNREKESVERQLHYYISDEYYSVSIPLTYLCTCELVQHLLTIWPGSQA